MSPPFLFPPVASHADDRQKRGQERGLAPGEVHPENATKRMKRNTTTAAIR